MMKKRERMFMRLSTLSPFSISFFGFLWWISHIAVQVGCGGTDEKGGFCGYTEYFGSAALSF